MWWYLPRVISSGYPCDVDEFYGDLREVVRRVSALTGLNFDTDSITNTRLKTDFYEGGSDYSFAGDFTPPTPGFTGTHDVQNTQQWESISSIKKTIMSSRVLVVGFARFYSLTSSTKDPFALLEVGLMLDGSVIELSGPTRHQGFTDGCVSVEWLVETTPGEHEFSLVHRSGDIRPIASFGGYMMILEIRA